MWRVSAQPSTGNGINEHENPKARHTFPTVSDTTKRPFRRKIAISKVTRITGTVLLECLQARFAVLISTSSWWVHRSYNEEVDAHTPAGSRAPHHKAHKIDFLFSKDLRCGGCSWVAVFSRKLMSRICTDPWLPMEVSRTNRNDDSEQLGHGFCIRGSDALDASSELSRCIAVILLQQQSCGWGRTKRRFVRSHAT